MKHTIINLIFVICMISPVYASDQTEKTMDQNSPCQLSMEKASQFLEKKELDKAISELQSAIPQTQKKSEFTQLYFVIGYVYQAKNEPQKAIENYKKSLEYDENYLDSINNLASLYTVKGEESKALELYNKAFKIQKKHPKYDELETHFKVWEEAKDGETFFSEYQKVETLEIEIFGESHIKSAEIYNKIGLIFLDQGQYDDALETFQSSLAIRHKFLGSEHSDVAISYLNFGKLYKNKKDFKKALDYYNKALNIAIKGKYKNLEGEIQNNISEL